MPRPKCCRRIGCIPDARYYQPEGNACREGMDVILTLDEFEAIRLADHEHLYQEQAALRMRVSRQTFGRIIDSAHKKIAEVLIMGKALRIEGGDVSIGGRRRARCEICKKAVGIDDKVCLQCAKLHKTKINYISGEKK